MGVEGGMMPSNLADNSEMKNSSNEWRQFSQHRRLSPDQNPMGSLSHALPCWGDSSPHPSTPATGQYAYRGELRNMFKCFVNLKKNLVFLWPIVFKNYELKSKPGAGCVASVSATADCIPSLFATAELGRLILFKIDLYEIIFILGRFLYSISPYGSFLMLLVKINL